jgi:hypothetical protein
MMLGREKMNKYKVFLNGSNFWMKTESQPKLMGLYTTRFLEADTSELAETCAIRLIRGDAKLRESVIDDKSDPPMIHAEEVVLLQTFEGTEPPDSGYTFFFYDEESTGKG